MKKASKTVPVPLSKVELSNLDDNSANETENNQLVQADRIDIDLGKRLKSFRQQADKTQADVAAFLEISPQQYQKYEKGASKCNIANIYRLAVFYNRPITDLLPGSEMPAPAGFKEDNRDYPEKETGPLEDETAAMAELLAVFVRIPSKSVRRKILNLLKEMI